jgi:hypothetical protein
MSKHKHKQMRSSVFEVSERGGAQIGILPRRRQVSSTRTPCSRSSTSSIGCYCCLGALPSATSRETRLRRQHRGFTRGGPTRMRSLIREAPWRRDRELAALFLALLDRWSGIEEEDAAKEGSSAVVENLADAGPWLAVASWCPSVMRSGELDGAPSTYAHARRREGLPRRRGSWGRRHLPLVWIRVFFGEKGDLRVWLLRFDFWGREER